MLLNMGNDRGRFIDGMSVQNQHIEPLKAETNKVASHHFQ